MKLRYFTSLPIGNDGLKIAQQMVTSGFPMLFSDSGKKMIDLYTTDPDLALKWVDLRCEEWAYIEFTSYYNDENEDTI